MMTISPAGPSRSWSSIISSMSVLSSCSRLPGRPLLSLMLKTNVPVSSISLPMLDCLEPMNAAIMPMGTPTMRHSPARCGGRKVTAFPSWTAAKATRNCEACHRCSRVPASSAQPASPRSAVADHFGNTNSSSLRLPLARTRCLRATLCRRRCMVLGTILGWMFRSMYSKPMPLHGRATSMRAAMVPFAKSSKATMTLTSVARRSFSGPKITACQEGLVLERSTSSVEPSQHQRTRSLVGAGRPSTVAMCQVPADPHRTSIA
mmetsp:Transcript_58689/g.184225  ORF Transcript_58689/g.184225 Transcript_58689/m.184225 type:complete len:262 (+) Transcript_58689:2337-3122(+)